MLISSSAQAHKLREQGEAVSVADSAILVTPSRDWNRLDVKSGKNTETWTLDGEQLNDVTFFGGIAAGKTLIKERDKKREPLPQFTKSTLIVEIPELLEGTYRTDKKIVDFQLVSTEPAQFLQHDGAIFKYQYTDADDLTKNGEAHAAIIDGKLYMMTFEAPRLHYYDAVIGDFQALVDSASLS